MKIIRDEQGRVVQVIKEESDGDYNTTMEVFKMILECEKCVAEANRDIALAKSQEQKDIYAKALQASTSIIKSYTNTNNDNEEKDDGIYLDEDQLNYIKAVYKTISEELQIKDDDNEIITNFKMKLLNLDEKIDPEIKKKILNKNINSKKSTYSDDRWKY